MRFSKARIRHRIRSLLLGLFALILGLLGSYLVLTTRLSPGPRVSDIPPGVRLFFPGAVLLILGAIVAMARSVMPIKHELRFCPLCGSDTNQFLADPRFRDGKKIGDSYVCEICGQKYLVPGDPCGAAERKQWK